MIYGYRPNGDPFTDLQEVCSKITNDLRPHKDEFEAIACTGISGVVVAPTIALRLHKRLIVVRKPDDQSTHSFHTVEGSPSGPYLFLDDFIGSATTLRRTRDAIIKAKQLSGGRRPELVATYEYQDRRYLSEDQFPPRFFIV